MRPAEASEAFHRGNRFLAPEAVRMGLINAAVPADETVVTPVSTLIPYSYGSITEMVE